MREEVIFYRWTCDDCDKIIITPTRDYPEGWDEVDDGPKGECQDVCEKCVKNHVII